MSKVAQPGFNHEPPLSKPFSLINGFNFPAYNQAPKIDSSAANTGGFTSLDNRTITTHLRSYERKLKSLATFDNRGVQRSRLVKLYQTLGLNHEADKLQACCQKFGVMTCGRHLLNVYPTQRCRVPLCPDCAELRQKRAFKRLFPKIREFTRIHNKDLPVSITLTVKNSSRPLADIHRDFRTAFKKLIRLKRWKHHIRGGIISFELTVSALGEWHYHAHIFAFRKSRERYEQPDLCADWEQSNSGAGNIAWIEAIKNGLESGFREVVKYTFKPVDLMKNQFDAAKLRQFYELSKRSRLASSFGEFYGFNFDRDTEPDEPQIETDGLCPKCGDLLRFEFMTRRELIDLRSREHRETLINSIRGAPIAAVFKFTG
jgi:hypothetical protein